MIAPDPQRFIADGKYWRPITIQELVEWRENPSRRYLTKIINDILCVYDGEVKKNDETPTTSS